MDKIAIIWKYLKYRWRAKTAYDVHSPFLFDFIEHVLKNDRDYYIFEEIEELRNQLIHIETELNVIDYGAGSKKGSDPRRKISTIAKNTLITPKFGRLLFYLAEHYGSKNILELGTSLGISTLYLAGAKRNANIISLEGSPEIANFAKQNFARLHIDQIEIMTGEFSQTLPLALKKLRIIDLAFIDGNHRREPTIRYFEEILPFCHDHSILVFDDIHWSTEMEEAWNHIIKDKRVSLSIDLFFKGIVFLNTDIHEKTNVTVLY